MLLGVKAHLLVERLIRLEGLAQIGYFDFEVKVLHRKDVQAEGPFFSPKFLIHLYQLSKELPWVQVGGK